VVHATTAADDAPDRIEAQARELTEHGARSEAASVLQ
jgi:hypothetical protein